MNVTRHGEERLRKRVGLPKRIVSKQVIKARQEGKPPEAYKGAFFRYLKYYQIAYKSQPLVYQNVIYFFSNMDGTLITAWQVPRKYMKYARI